MHRWRASVVSLRFCTTIRAFSVLIRLGGRRPTICKNSLAGRFGRVILSVAEVTLTLPKHNLASLDVDDVECGREPLGYLELNNLRRELTTFCTASTAAGKILYGAYSLGFAASPASTPRRQARRSSVLT